MSTELRRAAYHEAGHAIADHVLGFAPGPVSIARDGSGLCIALRAPQSLTAREKAAAVAVTVYAGLEAEMRLAGDVPSAMTDPEFQRFFGHVKRWWAGDALAVSRLAKLVAGENENAWGPWADERRDEAQTLLAEHWSAVQLVAAVLLERRRLSGVRVAELVRRASV